MGISKLTLDLQPYLESIELSNDSEPSIVIIDGPALVYHIYNQLAAHKVAQDTIHVWTAIPSYEELNSGVVCFLDDLERCYSKIQHIYFDGGLPQNKSATRLERLEKARAQLVKWRTAVELRPVLPADHFEYEQSLDLQTVLWHTPVNPRSTSSVPPNLLPVAPFIVPSALHHLRKTRWATVTTMVPEEADTYCAAAAALITEQETQKCLILTNDSDLVLYPATRDVCIVLLRTITLVLNDKSASFTLNARCWRPRTITSRLNLSSLLTLGFERSLDSTASFTEILRRARLRDAAQINTPSDATWDAFRKQYDTASLLYCTQTLDPRLNELVVQLGAPHELDVLHVYLPLMVEDPQRASSWQCGSECRQLAYSILVNHFYRNEFSGISISEHTRSGARIIATQMPVLSQSRQDQMRRKLEQSLSTSMSNNTTLTTRLVLDFYLFALKIVLSTQSQAGRALPTRDTLEYLLGLRQLPLATTKPKKPSKPQQILLQAQLWSLLHLNASVHAVLYSLRLLQQAMTYAELRLDATDSFSVEKVFDCMPDIAELFVNHPAEMRARLVQEGVGDDVVRERLTLILREVLDGAESELEPEPEQQQQQDAQPNPTGPTHRDISTPESAPSTSTLANDSSVSNSRNGRKGKSKNAQRKRKRKHPVDKFGKSDSTE